MNDDNFNEKVTRLLVDDSSDFGFHAAYLAYSKAWVENLEEKVKELYIIYTEPKSYHKSKLEMFSVSNSHFTKG